MKNYSLSLRQLLGFLWISFCVGGVTSLTAVAAPSVESYTLISSVRTGRTTFDYTYRPLIRVDSNSYRNASFTITSSNPATQIVKASINAGDLDAGNVVLAPDTFTIRQDRLVPFDRAALQFAFSGTMVSKDSGPSGLSIGKVTFLEPGGRPGHEMLLAMQGSEPPAGQSIAMTVDIYGLVASATYRLLDKNAQELGSGSLNKYADAHPTSPRYGADVPVPIQPFTIEISAVGQSADTFVWRSRLYAPTLTSLRIEPLKGVLSKGETVPVTLRLASASSAPSANYTVRLWLPPSFSGAAGPWTLAIQPGETRDISTSIAAPTAGAAFVRYTVVAEALAAAPGATPVSSTFVFEVE